MFEQTGVDAIMIGRASIGNPWIFKEIQEYLTGQEITPVSNKEKLEIILEHIDLQVKYLGENTGIKEMRKYMNQIETKQELQDCIITYFKNI